MRGERDPMDQPERQEYHSPQTQDPPCTSEPPLCRSYTSTAVVYCVFGHEDRLAFASGRRQLHWWHNFNQMLEIILGRYGAVSAERSEEGVCGVLGVSSADQETDHWRELKAVQCALDLLDAIQEIQLPGGGTMPVRIGLHLGAAADGLVGYANTLQYRLAGPALSVARSLASAAPLDGVLASAAVVKGQQELEPLWRPAQQVRLCRGATIDTYLLPIMAAPAYAQHPSAPQARTFGPSDFTACKIPCAAAAWRVHDSGATALHNGLPPGYQTWALSARATASWFAGRDSPAAPVSASVSGSTPQAAGGHPAEPAGSKDGGGEQWSGQRLCEKALIAAPVTGSSAEPAAEMAAAAAAAAYKLLLDDPGSTEGERTSAQTSSSSDEDIASSGGPDNSSEGASEESPKALLDYAETAPGAELTPPMGLGAPPSPRPRRWTSVAPSAWGLSEQTAGSSLHSLPHLDDSLLLAGPGQLPTPVHRAAPAQPQRNFLAVAPKPTLPHAASAEPTVRPAMARTPRPGKEAVAAPPQHERRLLQRRQKLELAKEPEATCSSAVSTPTCGWHCCREEPVSSCWRGVAAAVAARFSGCGGRLLYLDLPDGTTVLQDARLEFTDPALEGRFKAMWARHKRGHDRAVIFFFLAMFALRELRLFYSPGFTEVTSYTPGIVNVAVACFLFGLLALMHISRDIFERQRANLTLLMRIVRVLVVSWHHVQANGAVRASCRPGFPLISILARNAVPWAAMSMCEGNLLGIHLLGDAFALAAAATQVPWLCGDMCTGLGYACCSFWVIIQAMGGLLLPTAMMYVLERRVRVAFLHSVFAPGSKATTAKEGYEHLPLAQSHNCDVQNASFEDFSRSPCREEVGCSTKH